MHIFNIHSYFVPNFPPFYAMCGPAKVENWTNVQAQYIGLSLVSCSGAAAIQK